MIIPFSFIEHSEGSGSGGGSTIPKPIFNPSPGFFDHRPTGRPVGISTTKPGATMRYTTNGTQPSVSVGTPISSTSGSVTLPTNTVTELNAVTIFNGVASNVTSGTYDVIAGA